MGPAGSAGGGTRPGCTGLPKPVSGQGQQPPIHQPPAWRARPVPLPRAVHAAHVSPPHSSPSASSDSGGTSGERLGPLGQPIRRTNTFTASLATLEEREHHLESEELHNNAAAAAALAQHAQHAAAAAAAAAEPPAALAGHMHLSNSGGERAARAACSSCPWRLTAACFHACGQWEVHAPGAMHSTARSP